MPRKPKIPYDELIGTIYGRRMIIANAQSASATHTRRFLIRCLDCGNEYTTQLYFIQRSNGPCKACTAAAKRSHFKRGEKYGKWTVISDEVRMKSTTASNTSLRTYVLCRCSCGAEKWLSLSLLRRKNRRGTTQCRACSRKIHGASGHPYYSTYKGMIARCYNDKHMYYKNYGARGVGVYDEWKKDPVAFCEWIQANLGQRPAGYSLDRLDVNKDYQPGNIRWAPQKVQAANKLCYTDRNERVAAVLAQLGLDEMCRPLIEEAA